MWVRDGLSTARPQPVGPIGLVNTDVELFALVERIGTSNQYEGRQSWTDDGMHEMSVRLDDGMHEMSVSLDDGMHEMSVRLDDGMHEMSVRLDDGTD